MPFVSWFRGIFGGRINGDTEPTAINQEASQSAATSASITRQPKRKRSVECVEGFTGSSNAVRSAETNSNNVVLASASLGYRTRGRIRAEAKTSLFASIIQPLVENEFLNALDMGKLAQVCKVTKEESMNEEIWAALCVRDYPISRVFSESYKQKHGFRQVYKRWCAPVPKRQRPSRDVLPLVLPPPRHKADEVFLTTTIKYDGKPIYSGGSYVSRFTHLLNEGGCVVTLAHPFVVGKAKWNTSQWQMDSYARSYAVGNANEGLPVRCDTFDRQKFEISIHLHRHKEKMICVFRSQDRIRESRVQRTRVHPIVSPPDDGAVTSQSKFDLTKEQIHGSLAYKKLATHERLPFKTDWLSLQVAARLPHPIHFACGVRFGVVGDDDFAITHIDYWAFWNDPVDRCLRPYNSVEEVKEHGVTLLHILSALSSGDDE